MSIQFVIEAEQLRAALADIDAAEANGFMHCLAVFELVGASKLLRECRAEYSDLWERAHPTRASLDWGRFQRVSRECRFVDGKLVRVTPQEEPADG